MPSAVQRHCMERARPMKYWQVRIDLPKLGQTILPYATMRLRTFLGWGLGGGLEQIDDELMAPPGIWILSVGGSEGKWRIGSSNRRSRGAIRLRLGRWRERGWEASR